MNDKCICDEDKAGLLFVYALCYEKADYMPYALHFYEKVCDYEVDFYFPYYKLGQHALMDRAYEAAEYYLQKTLDCFDMNNLQPNEIKLVANLNANLANCLIKMHRLEDAKLCLKNSEKLVEDLPLRSSIAIVIDALEGNEKQVNDHLLQLEWTSPNVYLATKNLVDNIANKCDPTFFVVEVEEANINAFWQFFVDQQDSLIALLKQENYEKFVAMIQEQLSKVFTFMKDGIEVGIEDDKGSYNVIFADFYMKSLDAGYERILALKPAEVKSCFTFTLSH